MLLSFFIILNALSNFEDVKSKPVLNSIALTFSNKDASEVLSPNTVQSIDMSNKEGDTLDKLQALFNAHITGVKITKNRLGTTMHLRMPLSQLESSLLEPTRRSSRIGSQKLGAPGTFLPTLLSLMQTRETEVPYRMDMVLNTKKNPAASIVDSPEQTRIDMQKIALISQKLEESGIQKKLMSAGLGQGTENMVDIFFVRYIPVNPLPEDSL